MKLSRHQRKLLIEAHPDRHGGDTSKLRSYYNTLKSRLGCKPGDVTCDRCGVTIQSQGITGLCKIHAREQMYRSTPLTIAA
jgi:hypothetical protein